MTTDIKKLEDKISDLECQMAFQEQTVEELNDALSQQQLLITNMQVQMKFMVGKMKTMDTSSMAAASEETPPPHY